MRYAIALVLLCGSASAAEWSTAATGSFQGWASAEVQRLDAADSCRCGASCDCVDCGCPGCPHRKPPHLVASVWSSGCVHGERWLREAYPELLAKGWRIEVRRVPSDSGVACPTFTMGGRTWSGYTSKASHFAALRPETGATAALAGNRTRTQDEAAPVVSVESVRVMHDARPLEAAKPVQTQPARLYVPRLPGTEWSGPEQSRESIISHLLNHPNHRGKYSAAQLHALDYRSLENLHDNDHNNHPPSASIRSTTSGPVTYQVQPVRSACPGGSCPSPQRSGGLFGWGLFR